MPSFQSTFLGTHPSAFGACRNRATVDISAAAEFTPAGGQGGGIAIFAGQWFSVVGTSASSPIVAGVLTRLNLAIEVSNDFGYVYEHIADFNDVTSGNNDPAGICTDPIACNAGPGWDGPTGVGTPNGRKLALLVGGTGGTSGTSGGGDDGGVSEGGAGVESNADDGGAPSTVAAPDASEPALSDGVALQSFGGSPSTGCSTASAGSSAPEWSLAALFGILAVAAARRRSSVTVRLAPRRDPRRSASPGAFGRTRP
jgi:MYXO-CTERM domain-containing protein